MLASVFFVYSRDHVADWQLWLAATVQHHERVSYCISLVQEEMKIKNLKGSFLLNAYHFSTITKSKDYKLDHCMSGTVCNFHVIKLLHTFWVFFSMALHLI